LHLLQPLARLVGRVRHGLSPWRRRTTRRPVAPWPTLSTLWPERWEPPHARLHRLEEAIKTDREIVQRGGEHDSWDLEARDGLMGAARLRMAVEEHGAGRQVVRLRSWPRWRPRGLAVMALFAALAVGAVVDGAWIASAVLGAGAVFLALRSLQECGIAMARLRWGIGQLATDSGLMPDGVTDQQDHMPAKQPGPQGAGSSPGRSE
jgi:hypothetical protein